MAWRSSDSRIGRSIWASSRVKVRSDMGLFYWTGLGKGIRCFPRPALHFTSRAIFYSGHFLQDMDSPSPAPSLSSSSQRNIYVFGLTSFLNDTASEMAYWVLPAFLASLGAGPAQLGIIEGIAESVASFAKLFSGYLADKVARRKPLVVGGYVVANAVKPLLALVSS